MKIESDQNTIQTYMQDVGNIPLLDREEETKLAARIAEGCEYSRRLLIISNLRLVVKIAYDYKNYGLPLLDLVAEGNLGLMRAADKFDPAKGAKFSSYASWWIKQFMRRAINEQGKTIRIPSQSANKINKIAGESQRLKEKLGHSPNDEQIAEKLGYSKRTVRGLRKTARHSFSFHEYLQQTDPESSYEEIILHDYSHIPDSMAVETESWEKLFIFLKQLDERERMIIVKRFGLDGDSPLTLDQLSEMIGRTRERVRQIQHKALNKLKKMIDNETSFQEPENNH